MLEKLFSEVISSYLDHTRTKFVYDDFTDIITSKLPVALARSINDTDKYQLKGSVGTGNWAETPWVAILDKQVTSSTQNGYYVCYLINPNNQTMFLSLAVGWTQFGAKYPVKIAKRRIAEYSDYLCGQLQKTPSGFIKGSIDLSAKGQLSKGYEGGQILSKRYELDAISDKTLQIDLANILAAYEELTSLVGNNITNVTYDTVVNNEKLSATDKEINRITLINDADEALRLLDEYITESPPEKRAVIIKKAVRNPKIAKLIKQSKKYVCEICGREPFIQKNGQPYAEADHIKPLGDTGNDSADNMRCLCAQCHAIITYGSDKEIKKLLNV